MASNRNIQATLDWAIPYVRFQPLTIGGQEPALSSANMTLQVIVGPPFQWPWNRNTVTFACAPGAQDYIVAVADFGYGEVASVADTTGVNKEVTFKKVLALDGSSSDRPAYIAVQMDDDQGNITFRLSPPPDQAYLVTVTYQKKAQPILSLAGKWSPIPDQYGHICDWGFLTMASMLTADSRLPMFSQKFVGHLLGSQSGLTEREINIFLSTYLQRTGQVAVAGITAQQGVTARTF